MSGSRRSLSRAEQGKTARRISRKSDADQTLKPTHPQDVGGAPSLRRPFISFRSIEKKLPVAGCWAHFHCKCHSQSVKLWPKSCDFGVRVMIQYGGTQRLQQRRINLLVTMSNVHMWRSTVDCGPFILSLRRTQVPREQQTQGQTMIRLGGLVGRQ